MSDAVDAAVAAAGHAPAEHRSTVQIGLPTGRAVIVNLPTDIDTAELLALAGYVATGLPRKLGEARTSGPRLLVPTAIAARKA